MGARQWFLDSGRGGRQGPIRDSPRGHPDWTVVCSGSKGERQNPLTLSGVSPDGKRIYYSAHTFDDHLSDGTPKVVGIERDLASGTERQLRAGYGGIGPLSPDGRYFRFPGGTPSKRIVSLLSTAGGEARELIAAADLGQVLATGWTGDSSEIVFLTRNEMWRVPVSGGAPRKLDFKWDPSYPAIGFLTVNPDNKRVAFQAQTVMKPTEVWALENFLPKANEK